MFKIYLSYAGSCKNGFESGNSPKPMSRSVIFFKYARRQLIGFDSLCNQKNY